MARGGGAELVTAADMAFAAIGRAGLGQVEALMGLVPGEAGTQYAKLRMGRARALEVVLGADLFDAETAEPTAESTAFCSPIGLTPSRIGSRATSRPWLRA